MQKMNFWKKGFIVSTIIGSLALIAVIVLCCVCFILPRLTISKQEFLDKVGENINIPIIEINTQGGKEPYNKEDYINCSFEISNCENDTHNFKVEMTDFYGDDNSVGIRLRGNSTLIAPKKPYRIKFDSKKSLLGLHKAKSWVLLADYYDTSSVRNYTALSLGQYFTNLDFTPHPNHVALIMNGEFRGLYLLTEQIDEKEGRTAVDQFNGEDVNIDSSQDKDFPFLIEMDELAWQEGTTGVDNFTIEGFPPIEIKYPEQEERNLNSEQDVVFDYIKEYMNAVLTTLTTGESVTVSFRDNPVVLEELVDIDSMVDFYLLNEIMLNSDSIKKSIYMHKTKEGKLTFGPIWDFDLSMSTEWIWEDRQSRIDDANVLHIGKHSTIFSKFLKVEKYYNMVTTRFNDLKDNIKLLSDNLKEYRKKIEKVALLDAEMWYGDGGEFEFGSQYDYVRLFLLDRYTYLENLFSKTHEEFKTFL